ncbi:MAG: hypothetical protein EXQ92_04475 [Alphaproteobacteria bacterium]|nr:hypothetical protein [Alphaproteobacteria bacterium]
MRTIFLTALLLLAACEAYKERALTTGASDAEADHAWCIARGHDKGTEAHGVCVLEQRLDRAHRRADERAQWLRSVPTFDEPGR